MYVVLDILGKQFRVKENDYVYVPKLGSEVGSCVELSDVLMINDGVGVRFGSPTLSDVQLRCRVMVHLKDDKVVVFKKKRRKGYKKKQGHRQMYTKVLVEKILNN